ncbi:MAG: PfkB family carbohydrate kinase, partial [Candidatus Methylumidiphilus sp.]
MKFEVLVVNANPLLNLVHEGDFKAQEINRVPSLSMAAEGKGVNVARVLARHNHQVALTGFAGGHSGAWLRDLIRQEGVTDALIETAAPLRVGFMASGRDSAHPTTLLPTGFPVTPSECQALLDQVEKLMTAVRLVIISGSVPSP